MLKVQEHLRSGKTLEDLNKELGIKHCLHPELPLAILNYDQIESPKTHPIVRECRALTLNTKDFSIVARSFPRFFNWGELKEEMDLFDFSDFTVHTKEDGSLVTIYYFEGEWHANTRGSFALSSIEGANLTWREGFCKALGVSSLQELSNRGFSKNFSYVCEFCSPWNKVVRRYPEPAMFLLTAFGGVQELNVEEVDQLASCSHLNRPERFDFKSIEEIQQYISGLDKSDPTYEGVVICDRNFRRWKIKSPTYLGLHALRGEGDNLFNPKYLLPFVLSGEDDELLAYYEEVTTEFYKLKCKVLESYIKLMETWVDHKDIEGQKDFALAIKDKNFSPILFDLRKKYGKNQTHRDLKELWKNSYEFILKNIRTKNFSENENG